ncbi:PIG-X [Phycomyces nitens]|nr:PIG-X [Phycomyces nitens]
MKYSVESTLRAANSLHPHLHTSLAIEQPQPHCYLDLIYDLPPSVFVDPNQLTGLYRQVSVYGETDLEAPLEHVQEKRGSVVHLRFSAPLPSEVDLPLHLRYQRPSLHSSYRPITFPRPLAGWTCSKSPGFPPSLTDTLTLLPHNTSYATFDIIPQDNSILTLQVPVGRIGDMSIVEVGTLGCVVLGTLWIMGALWQSIIKRRRYEAKGKRRKSE